MKKKNIVILLFLGLYFLSSCSSLKNNNYNPNRVMLNNSNFKLIEGKYKINSIDNKGSFGLDSYLLGNNLSYLLKRYEFDSRSDSSHYVKFKFVDEKTLNVSYTENSGILKTKKIKGKLKDGYFELKRSSLLIPAILANLYRNRKFRIGLLDNGNLTTDYNEISFGTAIVIIPFWWNETDLDVEFERIQNE